MIAPMAKYTAVTAVYQPRDKGEPLLIRAGQQLELTDEQAEDLLQRGAIRTQQKSDTEQTEQPDTEPDYQVLLDERPKDNASKAEWVAYAARVPGLEPPASANEPRDTIIARVDQRLDELTS